MIWSTTRQENWCHILMVFTKESVQILKIMTLNIIFEEISESYICTFYGKVICRKLAKWFYENDFREAGF